MAIIALVSGGIDSLVMSKTIISDGKKVLPIFINYGQLSAEREWKACKELFGKHDLPNLEKINIEGYGKFFPSGLTNEDKDIHKDAFLPGRNMLFLLVAAAYAYQKGEKDIAIGLLSEKAHLFPDQTEEFIVNANFALNSAFDKNFTIITPLINFSKKDVIELAEKYKIDLSKTYSCHSGKDKYCGKCIACKEILMSGEKDKFPQFEDGK